MSVILNIVAEKELEKTLIENITLTSDQNGMFKFGNQDICHMIVQQSLNEVYEILKSKTIEKLDKIEDNFEFENENTTQIKDLESISQTDIDNITDVTEDNLEIFELENEHTTQIQHLETFDDDDLDETIEDNLGTTGSTTESIIQPKTSESSNLTIIENEMVNVTKKRVEINEETDENDNNLEGTKSKAEDTIKTTDLNPNTQTKINTTQTDEVLVDLNTEEPARKPKLSADIVADIRSAGQTDQTGIITGGAIGGCILIILVISMVMLVRQKNQRNSNQPHKHKQSIHETRNLLEEINKNRNSFKRRSFRKPEPETKVEMFHLPGIIDDRQIVIKDP